MEKTPDVGLSVFGDRPIRLHDDLYLTAPPTREKSSYVQAEKLLRAAFDSKPNASVAEIGCATGDFAGYLHRRHPNANIIGWDVHNELLVEARKRHPKLQFAEGSLLRREIIDENSQDVVTVLGVLSIFDELDEPLENFIRWLRPGGLLLIFNMFNPYPIDTWMRFERADRSNGKEVGWNIPSQQRVTKALQERGAKNIQFHTFDVDFTLERRDEDPMRTWTAELDGKNVLVNGSWIVHPFFFLTANKAS